MKEVQGGPGRGALACLCAHWWNMACCKIRCLLCSLKEKANKIIFEKRGLTRRVVSWIVERTLVQPGVQGQGSAWVSLDLCTQVHSCRTPTHTLCQQKPRQEKAPPPQAALTFICLPSWLLWEPGDAPPPLASWAPGVVEIGCHGSVSCNSREGSPGGALVQM